MDKLRALDLFVQVCECESYSATAQKIGFSPSSISKSISRLEEELGFKLFHRTTRNIKLSEQGKAYYKNVKSLTIKLDQIEESLRASNNDTAGVIQVNVPFDYGLMYIQPFLSQFYQAHSNIEVELTFDDIYVDSVKREVDILVRTGELTSSNLIAHKLSPMDFLICASPDYLERASTLKNASDFEAHNWLRFRLKNSGKLVPIMVKNNDEYEYFEPKSCYVSDNGLSLLQMCEEGVGVAQMPHFLAREGIMSGKLVSLFPNHCPPSHGVYIMYADHKFLPKRNKVFIEELVKFVEGRDEYPSRTWAQDLMS